MAEEFDAHCYNLRAILALRSRACPNLPHTMPEQDLLEAIRQNKKDVFPRLELWKEEMLERPEQAGSNPSYTLGKLLGYVSNICKLPASYSVDEWRTDEGHFCRTTLPGSCTFVNEIPAPSYIEAMIASTAAAVEAILRAGLIVPSKQETAASPSTGNVKGTPAESILKDLDMAATTRSEPTRPQSSTTIHRPSATTAYPARPPLSNSNANKLAMKTSPSLHRELTNRKRQREESEERNDKAPHLSKRVSVRISLLDFSIRGLFAAITSQMDWKADFKFVIVESEVQARLMVEPGNNRPPWMVCENGNSEKSAREAAMKRFFELLNHQGIIKPVDNLPPYEKTDLVQAK